MTTLTELWPPFGVVITEGDLRLCGITDDDLPGLVEVARAGIHPADQMPFSMPWTDAAPDELPVNMLRYLWSVRSSFAAEKFDLLFAVRLAGELAGVQALHTEHFAVTRTAETGSWLGRCFQGHGLGTRMRRAVCAFAFDELGAVQLTSGAFVDNPASLAVSRKVGYRPNGVFRMQRRPGEVAVNQRLLLSPDDFVRGEPVTVTGAAELRTFLGLD